MAISITGKILGGMLRQVREWKGKTQAEVSRISGLDKDHINRAELGKKEFSHDFSDKYLSALGVTANNVIQLNKDLFRCDADALPPTLSRKKEGNKLREDNF